MGVSFARPDVTDLVFEVFERTVHPELLLIHAEAEWKHPACSVKVYICDAGHVMSVRYHQYIITEVATSRTTPLPRHYRVYSHRLRGHQEGSIPCAGGIVYHVSFELEKLEPEVFANYHQELLADSAKSQISHHFATRSRLTPTPLSFMQLEATNKSLQVHTFHTFPDDHAIVKIQSRLEF